MESEPTAESSVVKESGRSLPALTCRFCRKSFSKGEHLRRHERSHVGLRPFTCKICNRSFGRQDSLARHERIHARDKTAPKAPSSETSFGARLPTPESSHASLDLSQSTPYQAPEQTVNIFAPGEVLDADLSDLPSNHIDFDLIWPDSESLFQSILLSDASSQWQLPIGTLPFHSPTRSASPEAMRESSRFGEQPQSIGRIPHGGNNQAIHDVSKMITNESFSVAAAVESKAITSLFLDECLHMFFVRFIPTFPVLHRATFVYRDSTHPLLLNAIAIGSLYLGAKDAVAKGEVLWRLAHTALATSWQSLITHRGPYDSCPGVQLLLTALLGQIYGSLSKNRQIRMTSQAFHSLSFFWAGQCGMLDSEPFDLSGLPTRDASEAEKDQTWKSWVAREIQQRTLLAHYILDGVNARMSGESASQQHSSNRLTVPGSDKAFLACTANEWLTEMHDFHPEQAPFRSIFRRLFSPIDDFAWLGHEYSTTTLGVLLEGLQSLVSDRNDDAEEDSPIGVPRKPDVQRALTRVYHMITDSLTLSHVEKLEALLRWHAVSIEVIINTAKLCRHLCATHQIEQSVWLNKKTPKLDINPRQWSTTVDGRRALLHAVAIQDLVEELPRGRAHAIHMPGALFAAATVCGVFCLNSMTTVKLPSTVDWDYVVLDKDGEQAFSESEFNETKAFVQWQLTPNMTTLGATRNLLYEFNSMQKLFKCLLTQWGVAADMENVVGQWKVLCHRYEQ